MTDVWKRDALGWMALLPLLTGAAPASERPGCIARPYAADAQFRAAGTLRELRSPGAPAFAPAATTGNVHALVILAEFSDLPFRAPPSRFQQLLFGAGPSLRDYYAEVSGGLLDVTGDVVGWVTLPQTELYYSQGAFGVGSYPNNGQGMAEDAVQAALDANPGLDLGSYDADGDGIVDALLVVHSGQGYEWAGTTGPKSPSTQPDPNAINSHKWVVQKQDFGSGAQVVDYFTCPELQLAKPIAAPGWADSVATIGVFCHEFGHILGLPDFYDTETFTNHLGVWDIMDFGTWNRVAADPSLSAPGALPGHYSTWSRMFLGWTVPSLVAPAVGESVDEVRNVTSSSTGGAALQLLSNPSGVDWSAAQTGAGEFFLAEVRTRDGYDAGLPAEGLLLYHVDESRTGNNASANADGGGLLRLLPQDGKTTLSENDVTDPWPGAQLTFGPSSNPASDLWSGSPSGVTLAGIAAVAGGVVTLTAQVANLSSEIALPFARPNPFRPAQHGSTGLVFALGSGVAAADRVILYDALGRRVRILQGPDVDPATGIARWDGARDDGRPAVAGMYVFRQDGGGRATGRVLLLR